jgi:hypothetical protein
LELLEKIPGSVVLFLIFFCLLFGLELKTSKLELGFSDYLLSRVPTAIKGVDTFPVMSLDFKVSLFKMFPTNSMVVLVV